MPRRLSTQRRNRLSSFRNCRSKQRSVETLETRAMLDATLVFNEINYHPSTNEPTMEWVEFYNQLSVRMDVSGWKLAGGADFTFPANTVVPSHGYLVIALSPTDLQNNTGFAGALGPFTGRLSNAGEELRLENVAGRIMDSIDYKSDGAWPAAPDGSGVTLSKRDPDTATDVAANWTWSKQIGGSPGAVNFPVGNEFTAPSGLVSYYDFDTLTGPAVDLADGNHGTFGAGATHVAGTIGAGAAAFNNSSTAGIDLGVGTGNNFNVTGGVSVEAAIKPTWNQVDTDTIFVKGPETGTSGLISYWNFDEAASGTAPALDGISGNTGTFNTGASHTTGLRGSTGAALFNNASAAGVNVGAGVGNSFSVTNGITLSSLIKPNWLGANTFDQDYIFRKDDGVNRIFLAFIREANNSAAVPGGIPVGPVLAFGLNVGGTYSEMRMPLNVDLAAINGGNASSGTIYVATPPGALGPNDVFLRDGNPHHLAATYSSTTGEKAIWIDGVKRFSWTLSGTIASGGAAAAVIGNSAANNNAFNGTIDDFAVWSTDLNATQIQTLANGTGTPVSVSPGTVASSTRILLALQNDGNNAQANPPVPAGPVLSFGLNVGGTYSELDMPLDGLNGRPTVAQLQDGAYHHVIGTYNAATGKKAIVIDGVERYSVTLAGNIGSNNGSHAFIGNDDAGANRAFSGNVDEVAYWNRALSNAEITNHSALFQSGQDYFNRPDAVAVPTVAFNEIAGANDATFNVELVNFGSTPVAVGGFVVRATTGTGVDYVIPAQTLAPGQHLAISQATLGADPLLNDKLFLYTPGKTSVVDAIDVRERLRGRDVPGTGRWLFPTGPTFGAANTITLHDEIVINELMYHHAPQDAIEEVVVDTTPIAASSTWKYDQSGNDLGTTWKDPGYNDAAWASGPGIFAAGNIPIPAGNARAGGIRFFPVTGDADSEISASKNYTHKVDFGPSAPALINGVQFDNGAIGSLPANVATTFTTTNAGSGSTNTTGQLNTLLFDSISGSGTVTLSGLTVGQTYDTRIYVRAAGVAGNTPLVQFNTDGVAGAENAIVIDENAANLAVPSMGTANQAYVLSYTFKAEASSLVVSFSANWQLYGLTNEVTARLPIGTLFSTGIGNNRQPITDGQTDPHYQLIQSAQTLPSLPAAATVTTNHSAWYANNAGTKWISVTNPGTNNIAAGDYVFRTTFDLTGFDPASALITMALRGDNSVNDVIVNGVSTAISVTGFDNLVGSGGTRTLSGLFVNGVNTIDFVLNNAGSDPNPGAFWANLSGSALPLTTATNLTVSPAQTTYYFRKEFTFAGDPADTTLLIQPFIDDGAVYYLNGHEVYRQNMPASPAPITASTPALSAIGTPTSSAPFEIPSTWLQTGNNVLAVEVHQANDDHADIGFDMSLRASEITVHGQPFADDGEEWLELYNKSNATVDLSGWKLDEAVDYTIPAGTTLGAGQYLVIAEDVVALQAKYPGITILGNYGGSLTNSDARVVLKDAAGNPADEVHYYDAGYWPELADGGGSSLELRDPKSDNSKAEAWAASDEADGSSWQTVTYSGVSSANIGPTNWNEFVMGLLGAGEMLIDDISVKDMTSGGVEKLQNGTFEALGMQKWRIIGNHKGSVIVDPSNPSNHVLRLVATGPTEHMHNHAETTFIGNQPIVDGRTYQISYRAKWVNGANQFNTRLYFNRLAETAIINRPEVTGTPGAQNSRYQVNVGPTYADLTHSPVGLAPGQSPAIPNANQAVAVSVRAEDPNGVASMKVYYRVGAGVWNNANMTLSNGIYTGTIPGQSAAAIVQFYVEGIDGLGAVSTFPAKGAGSRALYVVQDNQANQTAIQNFRIIMTPEDTTLMFTNTNVMSNDPLGATIITNESEVYYDVDIRLKSSQRGRLDLNRVGFHIDFHPDQLYRGVHPTMLVDRSGGFSPYTTGDQDEMLINHVINLTGVPGQYFDLARSVGPTSSHTGTAILLPRYEDNFLSEQFPGNDDGTMFELELIYFPLSNSVPGDPESLKLPQPDDVRGVDFSNRGDDKENYRWVNLIKNNRDADDYSDMIEFNKTLSLSGAALDTASQQVMDVDEWSRMFALMSLGGVNDAYTQGNNHNLEIYVDEDGITHSLPWDWDFGYNRPTNSALIGDQNLAKVFNLTGNRRLFMGHMQDLMGYNSSTGLYSNPGFNTAYLTSWATYYAGLLPGQNWSAEITWIGQRTAFVQTQFPASVPFRADYTGSNPVNAASITVSGDAWINAKEIRIQGRDEPIKPTWSTLTGWSAIIPLESGANHLVFQAIDFKGNVIGTDTVDVTNTLPIPSQLNDLRITEVMYHPQIDDAFGDNDLEFIELTNIGQSPLPLKDAVISGAASFTLPDVMLNPGQYVLIVGDQDSFETKYPGAGLPILGDMNGNLSNSSEQIVLTSALGQVIHSFTYSDLWYPTTDGDGYSLVIRDDHGALTNWLDAPGWRASGAIGGSPGAADTVASATIGGRHVFYNQSKFDGNSAAADANDDAAIATDKVALLPGGTASFANYTSFNRGLNGIMVDIAGLPPAAVLSASDFEFKVGNSDTPSAWATLAAAPTVSVRPTPGVPGSNRVSLIWPTGAAIKQWLQVTVKANANTGLALPDVFYFGNAVGESGNVAGDYSVSITDELLARNNAVGINPGATLINRFDYNRDGTVSVVDQLLARNNITTVATRLRQITVPPLLQAGGLSAQSLNDSSAIAHGLVASSLSSPSCSTVTASVSGAASASASRLQPQALSAAYEEGENLLGKRRTTPAANLDNELLELLASRKG